MALPSGVQIIRVTESTKFDFAGRAIRVKLISYMIGQDGPFTLEVLPENDLQSWIEGQLAGQAAKLAALRGNEA